MNEVEITDTLGTDYEIMLLRYGISTRVIFDEILRDIAGGLYNFR